MKHVLVAVFDKALDAYMSPWTTPTRGAAVRAFADAVQAKDTPMSKHPSDYELHLVGEWDDSNARIKQPEINERLAQASDYAAN